MFAFPSARTWRIAFALVLGMTGTAGAQVICPTPTLGGARTEQPTPPSGTAAEALASSRAGRAVSYQEIADAISRSGFSQQEIQQRLRSAGYEPSLADPFFGAGRTEPAGADSTAAPTLSVSALRDVGILAAEPSPEDCIEPEPREDTITVDVERSVRRVAGVFG